MWPMWPQGECANSTLAAPEVRIKPSWLRGKGVNQGVIVHVNVFNVKIANTPYFYLLWCLHYDVAVLLHYPNPHLSMRPHLEFALSGQVNYPMGRNMDEPKLASPKYNATNMDNKLRPKCNEVEKNKNLGYPSHSVGEKNQSVLSLYNNWNSKERESNTFDEDITDPKNSAKPLK